MYALYNYMYIGLHILCHQDSCEAIYDLIISSYVVYKEFSVSQYCSILVNFSMINSSVRL